MDQFGANEDVARRVQRLRTARGWSYRDLSEQTKLVGNRIAPSALQRLEKGAAPGKPRPRLAVDDLVTLCRVFDRTPDDLLTPIPLVDREHGKAIVSQMTSAIDDLHEAATSILDGFREVASLTTSDDEDERELADFVWNQLESWATPERQRNAHPAVRRLASEALKELASAGARSARDRYEAELAQWIERRDAPEPEVPPKLADDMILYLQGVMAGLEAYETTHPVMKGW